MFKTLLFLVVLMAVGCTTNPPHPVTAEDIRMRLDMHDRRR